MNQPTLCYYTGLTDLTTFAITPWYVQDVEFLQDMGFAVHIAESRADVRPGSDFFFAWWPTTGILPTLIARARRRPSIVVAGGTAILNEANGLEREIGFQSYPWRKRISITTALKTATRIIAISEHAAQQAHNLGAKSIARVPLAVDTDRYVPASALSIWTHKNIALTGHAPRFVTIVNQLSHKYLERKRIGSAIRALGALRADGLRASLFIIGKRGDASAIIEKLARDQGVSDSVFQLGQVSESEKIHLLQGALGYLQPTRHEMFGMAIAEAMSCGIAAISSPVGSVPEVIGETGFMCAADDHETIAQHMRTLITDDALRSRLGHAGRERILSLYSIERRRTAFQVAVEATFLA